MSSAIAHAASDHFVSAARAIRENPGLNRVRLYHLGLTGQVRVQLLPGVPPRYNSADVARAYGQKAGA